MKLLVPIIALLFQYGQAQSTQYVSTVPDTLHSIFNVAGTACSSDTDCDDQLDVSSLSGSFWQCVNGTAPSNASSTLVTDFSVCVFVGCETNDDCASNEVCNPINLCDDNGDFYPDEDMLFSSVCTSTALCSDIKMAGEWTDDTMCYVGEDEVVYSSPEEVALCGGTCIASEDTCVNIEGVAANCIDDKTCCNQDAWDQSGCIDLLFSEFLYYSIGAIALLLLCCCGCCCLIYKCRCCRKRPLYEEDGDDFENRTNHYNVYV
eukprot:CAMPEP_0197039070 /NCGR_PEP_ID=MMETSP1384-20130603/15929_1 /TAXON_ID=29189 /ORGANISM="Ammonia sp." /LENGTH=261 /DNA_ID=CAMNT_0042469613 /DNA_START=57 /DNA_END=842 /DNA_ORIENTATION=-